MWVNEDNAHLFVKNKKAALYAALPKFLLQFICNSIQGIALRDLSRGKWGRPTALFFSLFDTPCFLAVLPGLTPHSLQFYRPP